MKPSVLIGIPTLNGSDRLKRALEAVRDKTPFDRFDVTCVVADDGSTNENLAANRDVVGAFLCIPGMTLLSGHGRTGIAATWNRLAQYRDSEIIVLVNDDVEVVTDWLDVLAFSVLKNPTLGMVGLRTHDGLTRQQAEAEGYKFPRVDYQESRLLDAGGSLISSFGPIFAFSRASYNKVGGFDERYFCFYEEVDFGVALLRHGCWHAMAEYPICFHVGGATNSDAKNLSASQHMLESEAKFKAKWGASISDLRPKKHPINHKVEWCSQDRVWGY